MFRLTISLGVLVVLVILAADAPPSSGMASVPSSSFTLLAWNDLGMHCMDSDYAVFSILPPFNTIEAQLIDPEGKLVTGEAGYIVSYEAVADPEGSSNRTSVDKTNFWRYAPALYGSSGTPDQGVAGQQMPGPGNLPQPMNYDPVAKLWRATGIPITPYDDLGRKRYYPLMRVSVRAPGGTAFATTDVVLPVSDELDCRACHASGSNPDARPTTGWVWQGNAEYDHRGNILRLHDELQAADPTFTAALATMGYSALGLVDTVVNQQKPILCAGCHASNALPGTGIAGISALTAAIHGRHAAVLDPATGLSLDASGNRSACYRCHPGSDTRCLRGAMGGAVAADGSLAMQCQNCHGGMSAVGDPNRAGWLDVPRCQSCHTGNAIANGGQIRFLDAHLPNGNPRPLVTTTFASQPATPAPGYSLYRLSAGHGGLRCEACHGSTHAEYPGLHGNDNLQSLDLQGHVGMIADCGACHETLPQTRSGGPHGMHTIGQWWVDNHKPFVFGGNYGDCRNCHGYDLRGTELSRAQGPRVLTTPAYGTKVFERGMQVSCYECHDGPDSSQPSPDQRPTAQPISVSYQGGLLTIPLQGFDPEGKTLEFRIVEQPLGGTVGVTGATATYLPLPGFAGVDRFRYLAHDGSLDSLPVEVLIQRPASSTTSRSGYPGSLGAPTLQLSAPPVLGTDLDLIIGNSWGTPTLAMLVYSAETTNRPTLFGGVLWVRVDQVANLGLDAQGAMIPIDLPDDPALVGTQVHLQCLQYDPGAVFGIAFSEMLTMTLGS
ncbi:MAG: hypothetical protein H6807_04305 [Planctomycetes bacterium]|nr:hypothetical protein [Planctomycetota bacterium]